MRVFKGLSGLMMVMALFAFATSTIAYGLSDTMSTGNYLLTLVMSVLLVPLGYAADRIGDRPVEHDDLL